MDFITLFDYLLLPFYLFIILRLGVFFRNRHYPPGHELRKYFMPALCYKIGGAIFIGLLYEYYYHGGDTGFYFKQAQIVNSTFFDSPVKWFNLLLRIPAGYSGEYMEYISQLPFYTSPSSYSVVSITAIFSIFGANLYLPTAIIFATVSFTGIWALFRTFATQYPQYIKYVAIACLYVPSTIVWGSGIFKDTICMLSLGWITYSAFTTLINRQLRLSHFISIIVCASLILIIKIYILLAFIPALTLWILFSYSYKLKNAFSRFAVNLILPVILISGFVFLISSFSDVLGKYSLDNLIQTSTVTRDYIYRVSGDEGSAYDLGTIDPTPQGILAKAPLAINVALFRPYIWETSKLIMLLSALESFAFLLITLYLIFTVGPFKIIGIIRKDPTIQFCLIFTIMFAFSVGLSSYNFGTLSRYRIPCLPFYSLALLLIYAKTRRQVEA